MTKKRIPKSERLNFFLNAKSTLEQELLTIVVEIKKSQLMLAFYLGPFLRATTSGRFSRDEKLYLEKYRLDRVVYYSKYLELAANEGWVLVDKIQKIEPYISKYSKILSEDVANLLPGANGANSGYGNLAAPESDPKSTEPPEVNFFHYNPGGGKSGHPDLAAPEGDPKSTEPLEVNFFHYNPGGGKSGHPDLAAPAGDPKSFDLPNPLDPLNQKNPDSFSTQSGTPTAPDVNPGTTYPSKSEPTNIEITKSGDNTRGTDFNSTVADPSTEISTPDEGGVVFGDSVDFSQVFDPLLGSLTGFIILKGQLLYEVGVNPFQTDWSFIIGGPILLVLLLGLSYLKTKKKI